jgi:ADP-L-glycero-D-manno-heptose 6-epimerase
MIVVTGGAGMIGSRIIRALNHRGIDNILVVDDLTNGHKMFNLVGLKFKDYIDKNDFTIYLNSSGKHNIKTIFHQGACSKTTEWDGKYLMQNNYGYTKYLINWCLDNKVQLIYASSASVYGLGLNGFEENSGIELPINMYAYSKYILDKYLQQSNFNFTSQIVGLRYFNVYGPGENHKNDMASTIFHFNNQLLDGNKVKLFQGTDGISNGEQTRDFVYVDDCANINLWFFDNPEKTFSGIYNVGTGESRSFNDVAKLVISWHNKGTIEYIEFPTHLKKAYQNYTKANLTKLKSIGCDVNIRPIEEGIPTYLNYLNQ